MNFILISYVILYVLIGYLWTLLRIQYIGKGGFLSTIFWPIDILMTLCVCVVLAICAIFDDDESED